MKQPIFNILVRTSGRPNYFQGCIKSIFGQHYPKTLINLLVHTDDPVTYSYVKGQQMNAPFNFKIVTSDRKAVYDKEAPSGKPFQNTYLYYAPYNLYFNKMYQHCEDGFILFMDDDDKFTSYMALSIIAKAISSNDDFIMFRASFPNKIVIPSDKNFGKDIVIGDVCGGSVCFHSNYRTFAKWDDYSCGDYRVIKRLHDNPMLRNKYINEVLVGVQRNKNMGGRGKRDDT